MSNQKKKIFIPYLILIVVLMVVFGIIFSPVIKDMVGFGGTSEGVYIEIQQGATLDEISSTLKDRGIISNKLAFKLYAKWDAVDFKYGGHVFNTTMSYEEICDKLKENGTADFVSVVIPEGYELRLIAEACEKAGLVEADEFMNVAKNSTFEYDFLEKKDGVSYTLEGFLFPATYDFVYGTSAYDIIDKMLETFDINYNEEFSARAKALGMTDYEVVTLASVVEREAATEGEHKKVAGVFYNRINDGMKLESCATVQYILKERKPVLTIQDTKINSPYNTYINVGMPVGPIASPGLSAIEAVLYPEKHNYYFFVAKRDGSGHVFSKTFEEHNRAVSQNQ